MGEIWDDRIIDPAEQYNIQSYSGSPLSMRFCLNLCLSLAECKSVVVHPIEPGHEFGVCGLKNVNTSDMEPASAAGVYFSQRQCVSSGIQHNSSISFILR